MWAQRPTLSVANVLRDLACVFKIFTWVLWAVRAPSARGLTLPLLSPPARFVTWPLGRLRETARVPPYTHLLHSGITVWILAIVAKSLGAKQVIGVEYDSVCEENFMENLELNNMSEINFIQGDAITWMNFNFDVVLANINRNILLNIISMGS